MNLTLYPSTLIHFFFVVIIALTTHISKAQTEVLINNTLRNGSFETIEPTDAPIVNTTGRRAIDAPGSFTIPFWSCQRLRGFVGFDSQFSASDGSEYAFVNNGSHALFTSDAIEGLDLQIGDGLELTFQTANLQDNAVANYQVSFLLDGQEFSLPLLEAALPVANTFYQQTHLFQVRLPAESVQVRIEMNNRASTAAQPRMDDLLLRVIPAALLPPLQNEYYVSTTGDDSNDGTISQPFLTIQRAADVAQAGDTVYIRGGVYREMVTLSGNGVPGHPIIFTAFEDEDVTITATDRLTGFERTPEISDNNNVYVADLIGSTSDSLLNRHELTVIVNGEIVQEARSNNSADALNISTWDRYNRASGNTLTDTSRSVPFDSNIVGGYLHARINNFTPVRARITAASGSTLSLDRDISGDSNGFYLIHDTRSLVDSAGEWFFDEENNQFYLWAPGGGDPDNVTVEVKRRPDVFVTNDRDYIHFKKLTLTGGDFDMGSSNNLLLDDIHIIAPDRISGPDFGTTRQGLTIDGDNNRVLNSEFEHIWTVAIRIGGVGNVIANNHFHDICFVGGGAGGVVFRTTGRENLVSHNTFVDSGRACIAGTGVRNIFEFNDFSRIGRLTVDTGAFYYNEQGIGSSIIRYNTFHDISGSFNSGVYTDNGVTDLAVHHNLFYNISPFGGKFNLPNSFLIAFNNTYFNSGLVDAFGPRGSFGSRFYNNIYSSFDSDLLNGSDPFDFQGNFQTSSSANFQNAGSGDLRLRSSSGAIDRGIVIQGITDGFSGNAPDAGAIEFGQPLFETGHDFSSPPSDSELEFSFSPVIFSSQSVNGSFEDSLNLNDYETIGSPVVTDDSSSSYPVDPLGRFGARTVCLKPGDGISQTINNLFPNTSYILSGQVRIVGPILQAENATSSVPLISNFRSQGVRGQLRNNNIVQFDNVDFGSGLYNQLQVALATATTSTRIELFLDNTSGSPIATINAADAPNPVLFYLSNLNLPTISGTHDIILRFLGSGDLGLLDEIRLVNTNISANERAKFGVRDFNGSAEISQMTGDVDFSGPRPTLEFRTGPSATSATLFFEKLIGSNYNAYIDGISIASAAPTTDITVDLNRTSYNYDAGSAFQPDVQSGGSPPWELLSSNVAGDISWTGPVGAFSAGRISGVNQINQDFIVGSSAATLNHCLPNGRWQVTLTIGSSFSAHDNMQVRAENEIVLSDIDRNVGEFSNLNFEVDVTDGFLNLEFSDADSNDSEWILNRLSLNRIGDVDVNNNRASIILIDESTLNGSFEDLSGASPDLGNNRIGGSDTTATIPSWMAVSSNFGGFDDDSTAASSDGSEYAFANSNGSLTLTSSSASHTTTAGDIFTLSFDVGSNAASTHNYTAQLKFGSETHTVGDFADDTDVNSNSPRTYTFTYTATAADAGNSPIVELFMDNSGNAQTYIDNVRLDVSISKSLDTDEDQLPDFWEIEFFGDAISAEVGNDTDGDGQTEFEEFIFGTVPVDPDSNFIMNLSINDANETVIQWSPVIENREYQVLYSPDLITPFEPIVTGLNHPQETFVDTTVVGNKIGFYRMGISLIEIHGLE